MMSIAQSVSLSTISAAMLLLMSDPAHALRCGHKIVKDGMNQAQVKAICGEPVSVRHVGYVLRTYRASNKKYAGRPEMYYPGVGFYGQLAVTELLYNFGPRKLMRILRFEGDRLSSVETAGYGYLEKEM